MDQGRQMSGHARPHQERREGERLTARDAGAVLAGAWLRVRSEHQRGKAPEECLLTLICLALLDRDLCRLKWDTLREVLGDSTPDSLAQLLDERLPADDREDAADLVKVLNREDVCFDLKRKYSSSRKKSINDGRYFLNEKTRFLKEILREVSHELWGKTSALYAGLRGEDHSSYYSLIYMAHGERTAPRPPAPPVDRIRQFESELGPNREAFVESLAIATRVKVVGITHDCLVSYLSAALESKRTREKDAHAFWSKVEVVFLCDNLLDWVDDELFFRTGIGEADEERRKSAAARRRAIAVRAKHDLVRFLTAQGKPTHWQLFEYDYILPFLGALFRRDGEHDSVQIATLFPGRPTAARHFIRFFGPSAALEYYAEAFEEIVRKSTPYHRTVLTGRIQDRPEDGFILEKVEPRSLVLQASSPTTNERWIAAALVLLWQELEGERWPLLQVRTSQNATREVGRLSNISGYVQPQDCQPAVKHTRLGGEVFEAAARRELGERLEIEETDYRSLQYLRSAGYRDASRDHLYFLVFNAELLRAVEAVSSRARLARWSLDDILLVRKYQVLGEALARLENGTALRTFDAVDVLAANLTLHGEPALAEGLRSRTTPRESLAEKHATTKAEICSSASFLRTGVQGTEVIDGLAGLQYREFFSLLLPAYAQIGVRGAAERLDWVNNDPDAKASLDLLRRHYGGNSVIH
jgi:hypothetical protein